MYGNINSKKFEQNILFIKPPTSVHSINGAIEVEFKAEKKRKRHFKNLLTDAKSEWRHM